MHVIDLLLGMKLRLQADMQKYLLTLANLFAKIFIDIGEFVCKRLPLSESFSPNYNHI